MIGFFRSPVWFSCARSGGHYHPTRIIIGLLAIHWIRIQKGQLAWREWRNAIPLFQSLTAGWKLKLRSKEISSGYKDAARIGEGEAFKRNEANATDFQ